MIFTGFPTQHIALISAEGIIQDFTIEGLTNDTFLRLQKTSITNEICSDREDDYVSPFEWFGFYRKSYFYFISCNPLSLIIKHEIDQGKSGHKTIPDSKIPNMHYGGRVMGIHVGNFYWILGGTIFCGDFTVKDSIDYGNVKFSKPGKMFKYPQSHLF